MRPLRLLLLGALALLALAGGALPPQADVSPRYDVVRLGTLGGDESEAHNINERGVVVGEAQTASGETHAFLWKDGRLRDLGTLPGGTSSEARDLNEREEAVGVSTNEQGNRRAVLWDDRGILELSGLSGNSWANAINNRGVIVGAAASFETPARHHAGSPSAFRAELDRSWWGQRQRHVKVTPLSLRMHRFRQPLQTEAIDVNDAGVIVGEVFAGTYFGHATWPFTWENGRVRVEGGGDHDYWVRSINRHGHGVGMDAPESSVPLTAWVVRRGRTLTIRNPLGPDPYSDMGVDPRSINDRSVVVGRVFGRNGERWSKAFIWRNREARLISTLLPRDSGWKIHTANAINNRGQIVGQGTYRGGPPQAVLLQPRQ